MFTELGRESGLNNKASDRDVCVPKLKLTLWKEHVLLVAGVGGEECREQLCGGTTVQNRV